MFTKKDIDDLLRDSSIRIWYSFIPKEGAFEYVGERAVSPDDPDDDATRLFATNYFGDRLRLTLGPIVKTHSTRTDRKRAPFKQFPSCFDLRAMGNEIQLAPHEVISIQTNERIAIGPRIAATILPRLTNADSGLLYIPSYIDPYWDGVLQGVVINLTDEVQVLRLGEGIAICRFYGLSSPVSCSLRDAFPAKSHHYANNWPRILEEDSDPFPVRKRPIIEEAPPLPERIWRSVTRYRHALRQLGMTASVIVVVFIAGTLYVRLADLADLNRRQRKLEQDLSSVVGSSLPDLTKSLQDVQVHLPLTGTVSVSLPARQQTVTERVPLGRRVRAGASSWVSLVGRQGGIISLSSHIESLPGTSSSSLVVELATSADAQNRVFPLQWLVVE